MIGQILLFLLRLGVESESEPDAAKCAVDGEQLSWLYSVHGYSALASLFGQYVHGRLR